MRESCFAAAVARRAFDAVAADFSRGKLAVTPDIVSAIVQFIEFSFLCLKQRLHCSALTYEVEII